MRKKWIIAVLLLAIAALAIGGAGCKSSKKKSPTATATTAAQATETPMGHANQTPMGTPTVISATLTEYKITLDADSAPAGAVMFDVENIGGTDHELMIHKMEAGMPLPTKADGSVDEEASGVAMVAEVEVPAGESKELTAQLEPGDYVLLCNVVQETNGETVSHYAEGMHVEFTVTQ
jgi:uncharacterized cupredoxin-like copper-binding protein